MSKTLQGVNLGGWLVLEPWITRSLFDGSDAVDEYTFCKTAKNRRKLKKFRDSFITEADFAWLAEDGIEVVRLPVGYWLFGDLEPYEQTVRYVDQAFSWAEKHGIKILLSLHGAPGSQNGKEHSGRIGKTGWIGVKSGEYAAETLYILERIVKRYGGNPALLGLSLLNEPNPAIPRSRLESFYRKAYAIVRAYAGSGAWVVFSDGFRPRKWRKRFPAYQYPNMFIDYHHYQIFTPLYKRMPAWLHRLYALHILPAKLQRMTRKHPMLVGEWSLALPAKGYVGVDRNVFARDYAALQERAFSTAAAATFYWTYKTENGGLWDFKTCREQALL